MDKKLIFFKEYASAIQASRSTQNNLFELISALAKFDFLHKTTFEVSFKLQGKCAQTTARFLNIDADTYSCKDSFNFLKRLELYSSLIRGKLCNPQLAGVLEGLRAVSRTPMDLYFGADIKDRAYLFAFWLIFGGVRRDGAVSFWPYNFKELISRLLLPLSFRLPRSIKKDILNFGFDISDAHVFYKLYYLMRENDKRQKIFYQEVTMLNREIRKVKFFYFFSEMYEGSGSLIKQKLFIEFLEDIKTSDFRLPLILKAFLKISDVTISPGQLVSVIKKINGRISLVSIESNRALTLYFRQDCYAVQFPK